MAKYSIDTTTVLELFNNIRAALGITNKMTFEQATEAINKIAWFWPYTVKDMVFDGITHATMYNEVSGTIAVPPNTVCTKLSGITAISIPNVLEIGDNVFRGHSYLQAVDAPSTTSIGAKSFCYTGVISVNFPKCTSVGQQAFFQCQDLQSITLPLVGEIGSNAFAACGALMSANLPECTIIRDYTFFNCYNIATVNMPKARYFSTEAFKNCHNLKRLDCRPYYIGAEAFKNSGLTTLILRWESVCTLGNINVFYDTPISSGTGYIYVPAALVDSYKTATNWSTYANQIRAIEDYPDICGTTETITD